MSLSVGLDLSQSYTFRLAAHSVVRFRLLRRLKIDAKNCEAFSIDGESFKMSAGTITGLMCYLIGKYSLRPCRQKTSA